MITIGSEVKIYNTFFHNYAVWDQQIMAYRSTFFRLFSKWLFLRLIFPLLPILINFLVDYFFHFGNFLFPDEKIIIFSFLFPLIYLQEIDDQISRNILYIFSIINLILYVFTIFAKQTQTTQIDVLHNICNAGVIIFYFQIFIAMIYEIYNAHQKALTGYDNV